MGENVKIKVVGITTLIVWEKNYVKIKVVDITELIVCEKMAKSKLLTLQQ